MSWRSVVGGLLTMLLPTAVAFGQAPADPEAVTRQMAADEVRTRQLLMAHATVLSPADAPFRAEEFAPLLGWVKGKEIVMVSEPTHAMHECRAENTKLVRVLVERDGVRTLVLEVGYAAGLRLDTYVHGKGGDVDQIVATGLGMIWNTVEEADLLRWIAVWNRAHPTDTVRVVGMDIDATGAGGLDLAGQLRDLPLNPGLIDGIRRGAERADQMKGPAKAGADASAAQDSAAYDGALGDLVAALGRLPVSSRQKETFRLAMSVRDGRRSAELRATGPDGNDAGQRLREFSMARAALAIAADLPSPTVIVTHTIHLRPGRLEGDKVQSLGYHLARAMGDRVFFLGEEYGTGSMRAVVPRPAGAAPLPSGTPRPMHAAAIDPPLPGSVAAALGGAGPLLLDLRDRRDGSVWSTWLESLQATHLYLAISYAPGEAGQPNWTVPADAFDGMVYLPRVTALHPIGAPEYVP